ncbi:MAG: DegT/DnrJ/EryC1/StrS family aminotransferase [Chloroflexota bacterium]|nr:MAG: DegT/DnrJ/EryC1/StrS family aminotransferase [Chloroflexota bacterium]
MIPFFDLKKQYESIKAEIDGATRRVYASGWFILGPETEAFENEFAEYIGVKHGIGVNSGTDALHLAIRALGIGAGDEVITVPNTAVATIAAIEMAGATPVLCDVRADSMNMDADSFAAAITPKTRAVIPVHLFGQAAELDAIIGIARQYRLAVIEDCAQAHGATYQGQRVGSFGDVACFSFYPTKNLGAYGDGGAVVTNDARLAERVKLLRQYGWRARYESEISGVNSRLDELQAALLRVKLKHLDAWNAARRERAALYTELLPNIRVASPVEMRYGEHVYHLYVVQCDEAQGASREYLAAFLKEREIGTAVQYPTPIHLQLAYQHLARAGSLPVSEKLAREILSLPLYPELPLTDVRTVADAIREFEA